MDDELLEIHTSDHDKLNETDNKTEVESGMYSDLEPTEKKYPETWFVEKILKHRINLDGTYQYLLKWRDYPVVDDTWEHKNNVDRAVIKCWDVPTTRTDDEIQQETEAEADAENQDGHQVSADSTVNQQTVECSIKLPNAIPLDTMKKLRDQVGETSDTEEERNPLEEYVTKTQPLGVSDYIEASTCNNVTEDKKMIKTDEENKTETLVENWQDHITGKERNSGRRKR